MFIKQNIGIVSLGLIGGSLLKALNGKAENIYAVTRNPETIKKAKQYTDHVSDDYSILKNCDIVFVCSPMSETIKVLDALECILPPTTIVADVCSLKAFVSQKKRPYIFIGTHPMAGTENKGFESSFEGLFKGAKWVITPVFGESEILKDIIKQLGAEPVVTTPQKHDEAAALISHMPMLIAQAIFKTAQENELAMQIASSGFRDMTRLAMSNPEMADDMIQMNADNIQTSILKLYKTIGDLTKSNYLEQINEIKSKRRLMKF